MWSWMLRVALGWVVVAVGSAAAFGVVSRRVARAERTPRRSGSRRRTVVIVDDSVAARALMRYWLNRHGGFDIVGEACDGHDAIRVARELQPDLLILDVRMPRLDGVSALPLIRSAAPSSRVVVASVERAEAIEDEVALRGGALFVEKSSAAFRTELIRALAV